MEAEGLRTAGNLVLLILLLSLLLLLADAKESERKLSIHYEGLLNNLASDNHNLRNITTIFVTINYVILITTNTNVTIKAFKLMSYKMKLII